MPHVTVRVFVVFDRHGKPVGNPFRDPYAAYLKAVSIGGEMVPARVTTTKQEAE